MTVNVLYDPVNQPACQKVPILIAAAGKKAMTVAKGDLDRDGTATGHIVTYIWNAQAGDPAGA